LQDEDRVIETDWDKSGLDTYAVGEAARRDEDGYFWVIGRELGDVTTLRDPDIMFQLEEKVSERQSGDEEWGGVPSRLQFS
ncbi:MAG TPA: hypothetical protein VES62_10885, partial [Thermoleophilaceae bacterium]|nr:hypothetical protein [Thermoleophilaceae bacterium]